MPTGTIKALVADRGYGFIRPDVGKGDLFFHASAVRGACVFNEMEIGDTVAYDDDAGPDGRARASGVEVVGRTVEALPTWPTSGPDAAGEETTAYDWGQSA